MFSTTDISLLPIMSSSIFYRFKSQKDPQPITFDGTSLCVFEVKREIIALSKLGDGTDFNLEIYTPEGNESMYLCLSLRHHPSQY